MWPNGVRRRVVRVQTESRPDGMVEEALEAARPGAVGAGLTLETDPFDRRELLVDVDRSRQAVDAGRPRPPLHRFVRGVQAQELHSPGTGLRLGLTIIEARGGIVTLTSEVGVGIAVGVRPPYVLT